MHREFVDADKFGSPNLLIPKAHVAPICQSLTNPSPFRRPSELRSDAQGGALRHLIPSAALPPHLRTKSPLGHGATRSARGTSSGRTPPGIPRAPPPPYRRPPPRTPYASPPRAPPAAASRATGETSRHTPPPRCLRDRRSRSEEHTSELQSRQYLV